MFKYADNDTHCFPNFLWCFLRADINHPLLPAEMTARDLRPFSLRVGVMGVDGALLLGADRFLQWGQHVLQLSLLGHDEIQLVLQPARMGPRLEGHWVQGYRGHWVKGYRGHWIRSYRRHWIRSYRGHTSFMKLTKYVGSKVREGIGTRSKVPYRG